MEVDLSQLDATTRQTVDQIFREDYDLKALKAIRRQQAVAARNERERPRAQDGFGERVIEIDAFVDAIWRSVYGTDYTENRDLMKFLLRRNPEIGVRPRATRIQVGYSPVGTRYRKSYTA
nr:hypothetical protein [uncultured Rhodopila sp.]